MLAWLRSDPRLAGLEHKESWAAELPFHRMKVRLKKEIVTMGVPGIDPRHIVGTYVKPQDWNALISDPDVVVVDTRNDYEVDWHLSARHQPRHQQLHRAAGLGCKGNRPAV